MRILAAFAHPDDESYGPAGTLALAARCGYLVTLLTLTHGESGSLGVSKSLSAQDLANRRGQELRIAARKLGIHQVNMHQLSDKHLQDIPEKQGIDIISQELKRFKPHIVITFHENTISGHPDHLAVTNWTLKAVKSLPAPPKLFYFGLDREQTAMVTFRKLIPINSSEITHRVIVEDFIDDKIAAIRCHKTQNNQWRQFEKLKIDFKKFAKWEAFVQKWPEPEKQIIKHSLFEN